MLVFVESDPDRNVNEPPLAALDTLYLNMANKRRTAANIYLIASTFRYAIFAIVVVLMQDHPAQQIQVLLISSWFISAILMRTRPYIHASDLWTVFGFETLYSLCLALTFMFTPEYIYRSYTISKNMGFTICLFTFIAVGVGLLLILYSIGW